MKQRHLPALALAVALALLLLPAHAAPNYSFDFKVEKKKLEAVRKTTLETASSVEKWCYTVTIENHSFQDLSNLDIKYIIYYKNEPPGSKSVHEKHQSGDTNAALIANNADFVFDTDPVTLVKSQLSGSFFYESGAPSRSRDSITGIWLRLYQNGAQVGEFAEPPELTNGKWDVQ